MVGQFLLSFYLCYSLFVHYLPKSSFSRSLSLFLLISAFTLCYLFYVSKQYFLLLFHSIYFVCLKILLFRSYCSVVYVYMECVIPHFLHKNDPPSSLSSDIFDLIWSVGCNWVNCFIFFFHLFRIGHFHLFYSLAAVSVGWKGSCLVTVYSCCYQPMPMIQPILSTWLFSLQIKHVSCLDASKHIVFACDNRQARSWLKINSQLEKLQRNSEQERENIGKLGNWLQ